MSDYIQQLEEQNDELKQKLASEQAKVLKMESFQKLVYPTWEQRPIPVMDGCTDNREGCVYDYGGALVTYACVEWHKQTQTYRVRFSDAIGPFPIEPPEYGEVQYAQQCVEQRFKRLLQSYGYNE